MRWFDKIERRAQHGDPFAFQPTGPAQPQPTGTPVPPPGAAPSWQQTPGRTKNPQEKELQRFKDRDRHMRRIIQMLSGLDASKLASLADAMGRGDEFWAGLRETRAPEQPQETPQMPPQSVAQEPQEESPFDPARTPGQRGLQERLKGKLPPARAPRPPGPKTPQEDYEERLRANRPGT